MSETKKLYRSESSRVIGGVCAGLGEYLGVDAVLVRLVFGALALLNGLGAIAYVIMWLIVPTESQVELSGEDLFKANLEEMSGQARNFGERMKNSSQGTVIIGFALVGLGAVVLLKNVLPWLDMAFVWPVGLIIIGIYILFSRR